MVLTETSLGPLYTTAFTDLFLPQPFSTRHQIETVLSIRAIATAEDIAPFHVISVS
jgi:hypothetical protein